VYLVSFFAGFWTQLLRNCCNAEEMPMHTPDPSHVLPEWEPELYRRLPLFGHRNWIVITDAAYPAHCGPGIEMIVANGEQIHVIQRVLKMIEACKHVRVNASVDLELGFLEEGDAPGVTAFRQQLRTALDAITTCPVAHQELIAKLGQCAQHFRILIIKTGSAIPYSSVFLEFDCGYWSAAAEQKLRDTMRSAGIT
jgi:L-fucose mutarotase/ribose pyranase (RbsD/FucU family)